MTSRTGFDRSFRALTAAGVPQSGFTGSLSIMDGVLIGLFNYVDPTITSSLTA
jgi:endonuclease V-like protein UPF0215 family